MVGGICEMVNKELTTETNEIIWAIPGGIQNIDILTGFTLMRQRYTRYVTVHDTLTIWHQSSNVHVCLYTGHSVFYIQGKIIIGLSY